MNPDTVLLRQVHPEFVPNGELSSQAFFPFPKDEGGLSVYDGDQVSPPESHAHYTQVLELESIGVWGVTGAEASAIGLAGEPAPLDDFPAHAVIAFTGHPEKSFRKLAKKLKAFALARGCLYSPR